MSSPLQSGWKNIKISEIFIPADSKPEIPEDMDIIKALEIIIGDDLGRLIVRDSYGKIAGIVTRNGIARYIQIMGK